MDMDPNCQCSQLATLLHELNQSLLIIQVYASTSNERLKTSDLTNEQLSKALNTINEHTQLMGNKIHRVMSNVSHFQTIND